ncbi:MAG: thioredoxin family protein [Bacteroidales bacterium]|nr:thioredoxin family protein [Bacteroidales bacterium]
MKNKYTSLRLVLVLTSMLILWSINTSAQILTPTKWTYHTEKISDNEYNLVFKATIDQGWHLYSQDIPEAPPATTFKFEKDSTSYQLIGKVKELGNVIQEYDKNFQMELKYFTDSVTFVQAVKLLKPGATVKGVVNYMSCDNTQCLPPTDLDFSFDLGKITTVSQPEKTQISATADNDITGNKKTLWGFFIFAFIGGLLAIVTPCVFPMIPMTVSFFMKEGDEKAKGKFQAIFFGLSIILIYTFVGSVLSVIAGPDIANFLSTHWIPNVLFFIIFVVFAFSFFGMFEITLPHWLVNKTDQKADKGGFWGPLFMALTLVLVSFSCTGPIVGSVLVASAGGAIIKPIVGMLGFSLAFALPFTLFALFPSWLNNLPKSGGWLNSVKVVLGFLELALGLKFLSIADQTYHWHILDREVYLALWIVIFFLLGLYLLGKLKFAHDDDVKHVTVPRLVLSIITFSFVVYMIPGMFGAPLKALAGYLPPQTTLDFDVNKIIRQNLETYAFNGGKQPAEVCETPKYHEFLHLPHGLKGYFDYKQAVACAKEQNKPIFIDFTGHGCVNCREMEANVWSDPKVLKILRNDYVILALYVDDKYELPKSEWVKSTYDGKWKKTLGKVDADFQISKFGVNAQPYYVLLNANGDVLTQPKAYDLNVDHFVNFLEKGLENFKEGKSIRNINNK